MRDGRAATRVVQFTLGDFTALDYSTPAANTGSREPKRWKRNFALTVGLLQGKNQSAVTHSMNRGMKIVTPQN
mgnify:CR=1 FL=1